MPENQPIPAAAALQAELDLLRPRPASAPAAGTAGDLAGVLGRAHEARLAALCLSGGGIRSASFAVGFLEGMARTGRLGRFDYLSTVSGGGYAGAWLSAWRHHAARAGSDRVPPPEPWPMNAREPGGPAEPEPLRRLRRYVRYLAPHEGLLSIDLWTMLATMGRNLLLIWLVVLPVLGAALLVPYIYYAAVRTMDRPLLPDARLALDDPGTLLLLAGGVLLAVGLRYVVVHLPGLGGRPGDQRSFLTWCLAPVSLAAFCLTLFWATDLVPVRAGYTVAGAALLNLAIWAGAGAGTGQGWRPRTWLSAFVAGGIGGAGLWLLTTGPFGPGRDLGQAYVTFAFPAVLGLGLVANAVHVGLSREEMDDDALEWWARFGAWVLVVMVAWLAASAVVLWGPMLLDLLVHRVFGLAQLPAAAIVPALSIVAGLLGWLTARPGAGAAATDAAAARPPLRRRLLVPAFATLVLVVLALVNLKLLRGLSAGALQLDHTLTALLARIHLMEAVVLAVTFAAFGALMALLLPVNKYSLHGMYKNRLVRTFVGAARPAAERRPSAFTDFDPRDDLAMAELAALGAPLHVVNATLNTVADTELSRLQRKAEPFTISPLHAGAWRLGYRPAGSYASEGRGGRGITLGTAITISGAAASPNMGARSTPALTFVLTVLNARLGAWLGNPGTAGARTWHDANPRLGPWLLLKELAGATDDASPYVFLSDGGHFDNLGLYEMVRRRCRLIVVADAGADPRFTFDDLSNAIRLVRIDFSIPIDFPDGLPARGEAAEGSAHFSVGRIRYGAVDGAEAPDGILVYAKANITGDEPRDVLNYARSHAAFPHESTAEQFFSEAQFESYRTLGRHTAEDVLAAGVLDAAPAGAAAVGEASGPATLAAADLR